MSAGSEGWFRYQLRRNGEPFCWVKSIDRDEAETEVKRNVHAYGRFAKDDEPIEVFCGDTRRTDLEACSC